MEREIKFRGIAKCDVEDTVKKGEFIYGNLIVNNGSSYIVGEIADSDVDYIMLDFWVPVREDSVGQYTGLKDKNGKEVFEGDIVRCVATGDYKDIEDDKVAGKIRMNSKDGQWQVVYKGENIGLPIDWGGYDSLEIIGDIHENPELLTNN